MYQIYWTLSDLLVYRRGANHWKYPNISTKCTELHVKFGQNKKENWTEIQRIFLFVNDVAKEIERKRDRRDSKSIIASIDR